MFFVGYLTKAGTSAGGVRFCKVDRKVTFSITLVILEIQLRIWNTDEDILEILH